MWGDLTVVLKFFKKQKLFLCPYRTYPQSKPPIYKEPQTLIVSKLNSTVYTVGNLTLDKLFMQCCKILCRPSVSFSEINKK